MSKKGGETSRDQVDAAFVQSLSARPPDVSGGPLPPASASSVRMVFSVASHSEPLPPLDYYPTSLTLIPALPLVEAVRRAGGNPQISMGPETCPGCRADIEFNTTISQPTQTFLPH